MLPQCVPPALCSLPAALLSSILLSHTKNGCNRPPVLHLLVRENWLRSIVLKQKSIVFGSCPLRFNEFIFNNSIQLGTPLHYGRGRSASNSPCRKPHCSLPGPPRERSGMSLSPAAHRGGLECWRRGSARPESAQRA